MSLLEVKSGLEELMEQVRKIRVIEESPKRRQIRIDMERELKEFIRKHEKWFLSAFSKHYRGEFVEAEIPHRFDTAFDAFAEKAVRLLSRIMYKYNKLAYYVGQDEEFIALRDKLFEAQAPDYFTISLTLRNEMAEAILRSRALERATAVVTKTYKGRIAKIVQEGIEKGYSYDRTAKEISKLHTYFRHGEPQKHIRSHAHLIAVTENAYAYEGGKRSMIDEAEETLGVEMEKSWNTSGDDRVSDECADNESAGWIDKNQVFPSGHEEPPRFPGCRCNAQYRLKRR